MRGGGLLPSLVKSSKLGCLITRTLSSVFRIYTCEINLYWCKQSWAALKWFSLCTNCLCPPAARVLWGVSVSVVRPGEDVSAVPLHRHREPAMLEGRDHLGPLPDLLSRFLPCLLIWCAIIMWNLARTIASYFKTNQQFITFYLLWPECKYISCSFVAFNIFLMCVSIWFYKKYWAFCNIYLAVMCIYNDAKCGCSQMFL